MCVRKTPLAEVFYFLPGNGARKELAGATLTREVFFNLWKYSSLVPGNGARKELDCWLMTLEKSWCLVECPARWEPQEEGVMNTTARFFLS
jgi:hypothetical protein